MTNPTESNARRQRGRIATRAGFYLALLSVFPHVVRWLEIGRWIEGLGTVLDLTHVAGFLVASLAIVCGCAAITKGRGSQGGAILLIGGLSVALYLPIMLQLLLSLAPTV